MVRKSLLFPSIIFLLSYCFSYVDSASSTCPMDLSYVETFPWDKSLCQGNNPQCCQVLLSLFGMGLARHLKETDMFQLPNAISSSDCLQDFQIRLTAMSLQQSLVATCFNETDQFAIKASSCVGIVTREDWVQRVGATTQLDSVCKKLSGLTSCSLCLDAGMKVTSQLVSLDRNASSKCFYFTVLYAAAIVNDLGPENTVTASCILGLPLPDSTTKKNSKGPNRKHLFKLIFGFIGALVVVAVILASVLFYRHWRKRQKHKAVHGENISKTHKCFNN